MDNLIRDEIIAAAQSMYEAGLNVFPVQFASKEPYGSTSLLTISRIHTSLIEELFANSNIGVMTGRLSGNLFIIDCDTDETFEEIGVQLQDRGIDAWVRFGYRGGQYWLRCAEGEVRNENLGDLQVLGNRQIAVAPPSVHPTGVFYDWGRKEGDLPPIVSIQSMKFLGLTLAGDRRRDFKRDKTTLPPVAHRVLADGDSSEYHSNSEAEFAACVSLIASGMPDSMIRQLFAFYKLPHYMKSRGRGFDLHTLAPAHAWLEKKRLEEAGSAQTFEVPHSSQFIAYADARPWPGRTGNTDKAVYLALCARMRMDKGSRIFRASVREVSELANLGTQAVQSAVKRLKGAKLLKYESRDAASTACLYSLVIQEEMTVITTVGEAYIRVTDSVVINAIQDDVFHIRGLGKSACSIWQLLIERGYALTIKQIAETTGRATSTIRTNLVKLEGAGLVCKAHGEATPIRWYGCDATLERLQEIAEKLGTAGKAAARKARHLDERQMYVSHILMEQRRRMMARRL